MLKRMGLRAAVDRTAMDRRGNKQLWWKRRISEDDKLLGQCSVNTCQEKK